jgi:hypothetical protein
MALEEMPPKKIGVRWVKCTRRGIRLRPRGSVKRAECDGARRLCEDEHDGTTTADDDSNGEGGCINDDASEGERQSDNDHYHSNTKCGGGDVETSGRRSNFNGSGCDDFGGCSGHNSAGRRRCGLDLGHGSLDDVNVGDGGRRHQCRRRHLGAEEVSGKRSIDVGVNGAGEGSGSFGADERVELGDRAAETALGGRVQAGVSGDADAQTDGSHLSAGGPILVEGVGAGAVLGAVLLVSGVVELVAPLVRPVRVGAAAAAGEASAHAVFLVALLLRHCLVVLVHRCAVRTHKLECDPLLWPLLHVGVAREGRRPLLELSGALFGGGLVGGVAMGLNRLLVLEPDAVLLLLLVLLRGGMWVDRDVRGGGQRVVGYVDVGV